MPIRSSSVRFSTNEMHDCLSRGNLSLFLIDPEQSIRNIRFEGGLLFVFISFAFNPIRTIRFPGFHGDEAVSR